MRHTLLAVTVSALLCSPIAAKAAIVPILAPTMVGTGGANNDVAFNDKENVYLQVWGHPIVWGRFISADGAPLGPGQFVIASHSTASPPSDAWPRVAYSTGSAADDVFVVAYTSETNGGRLVFARTVRYNPATQGEILGPVHSLSTVVKDLQAPGGIAFNHNKRQFFLCWETLAQAGQWEVYGQLWQVGGSLAAPTLAPATAAFNISESPTAQGTPNVAYDWKHDTYMVVFREEHPTNPLIKGSWGRMVRFDPTTLAVSKSAVIELSSGFGVPAEQNVVYMPENDGFLTFWTDISAVRDLSGRIFDHNGTATSNIFPIIATAGNEGAADAKYNPYTRSIFVAAMRDATKYIQGIQLTAGGAHTGQFFQASTALPPANGNESFFPHIAVGKNGRFGLSYNNSYTFSWFELLQGVVVAGGQFPGAGSISGPPPPPPPPPCAVQPGTTALSLTGAGQTQNIAVTASTADCGWTATSSASWIAVVSGSSGAGPGTVIVSVARNTSGAPRTGTVSVAGGTVTVQQAASVGNAALHDMTGDGGSDLMWHNVGTGRVAVWTLNGHTVMNTYYLTSAAVDTNWKVVGTGDLDGDGYADVIWRGSNGGVASWSLKKGQIVATQHLVLNSAPAVEPDPQWQIRAVGDLDGDGKADIIWQHVTVGTLGVWFMDGTSVRSVASLTVPMPNTAWKIAGAGDLNADGKADIIWQSDTTGGLGAWLMSGNQVVGQSNLSIEKVPDTQWKVRGVGDTNGDGFADLLWQHTGNGSLAIWYMNNFKVILTHWLSIGAVPDTNWHVVGPG